MMTGSRLTAPEGLGELRKGVIYHFLVNDLSANRARLVLFDEKGTRADLVTLTSLAFEAALEAGQIVELEGLDANPPWLEPTNGVELSFLERQRVKPKESYEAKVNRRYLTIAELVAKASDLLASDDIEKVLNRHAEDQQPEQNTGRIRLWFFTYLVFGQTKWALMPRLKDIGSFDRSALTTRKLGRPSSDGKNTGYPITPEMKELIKKGFNVAKDVNRTRKEIYQEALTSVFGCKSRAGSERKEFYHPKGNPFPSSDQFWYWVAKLTAPETLARDLKGKSAARAQSGSRGKFSDSRSNLNQLVQYDGYTPSDKLTGITEGSAVDGFVVVRGTCDYSGMVVGIGFAKASETMAAYRMALFCTAIGKVKFCELFGMKIAEDEWPSFGLPRTLVFDRGPAAPMKADEAKTWLSRLELTPTHDGQAKAAVESSHPRKKKNKDQPTYRHSDFNFVEMSRAHIYQVLKDNKNSDASARMTPEMWMLNFTPTPVNVWKYWDQRGRNLGRATSIQEAVREFLDTYTATIRRDGVYFLERRYNAESLIATGVFDLVARRGSIKVKTYVLTMCVRHIWIEVEGVIHELNFVLTAGAIPASNDISIYELEDIYDARLAARRKFKAEQGPIDQDLNDRFAEDVGKRWGSGVTKLGRPAKNAATQRDDSDYKRFMGDKS